MKYILVTAISSTDFPAFNLIVLVEKTNTAIVVTAGSVMCCLQLTETLTKSESIFTWTQDLGFTAVRDFFFLSGFANHL